MYNAFHEGENKMKQGFFAGRVGADAEVTYTPTGIAIAKFSIAVDNGKDKNGGSKPATWVRCAIWRERAEKLAPYIKKGNIVVVSGDVEARAWLDKNSGEARCALECNVNQFTFGGGNNKSERTQDDGFDQAPAQPQQPQGASPITDEDIPF